MTNYQSMYGKDESNCENILVANEYLINNQVSLIFLIFPSLLPSSSQQYLHRERMKATVKKTSL